MDDYEDFDRLSSVVYVAARAGAVDCTAAFDLATSWLEERPQDPDATELATLSIECTQASQPLMAEVALRLLATTNFYPGFKEEPGRLTRLDGYTGIAQGIYPASGADLVSALVDVAEDAQDALMHALFAAWPVCPVHGLGVHATDHEEAAVWWCSGDGGHTVTAIGEWHGR